MSASYAVVANGKVTCPQLHAAGHSAPLVTLGRPLLHVPVEGSLRREARSAMLRASHSTLALLIPPPCTYAIKRATRTPSRRLWACYVRPAIEPKA